MNESEENHSNSIINLLEKLNDSPNTLKFGLFILIIHIIVAISGPFWAPYASNQIGVGIPASGMSIQHPMGLDQLGRDVFSRVIHGAHIVMLLAIMGTSLGMIIGTILGFLSAYLGGFLDEIFQRFNEVLISIPFLVFGLVAINIAGPKFSGKPILIIMVVGLVYFPRVARIARAAALSIITKDYITISRLRGESAWSVISRELLPNCTGTMLVEFALRIGYAPILIGSFGFLGFGVRPPTPEWGLLLSENRDLFLTAPSTVIMPGLVFGSLIVGLNLFSEGLARVLGRTARLAP